MPITTVPATNSRNEVAMNSIAHKADIKIIAIYSARKTITNSTDLYSVLNPLTNSLSPSAKSKGERLASAKTLTANIKKTIVIQFIIGMAFSCPTSHVANITEPRTMMAILTS